MRVHPSKRGGSLALLILASAGALFALSCEPMAPPTGWQLRFIDHTGNGADGVDVGDVNGDGRPDVTAGWTESGWVRLYVNPGPAQVAEAWPSVDVRGGTADPHVEDAIFADLDGDGRIEAILSAHEEPVPRIGIHWLVDRPNLLSASAWQGEYLEGGSHSYLKLAAGPLDRRRGSAIVAATGWGGVFHLFRSPENPRPRGAGDWKRLESAGPSKITAIWILDMDGDGDNDVLSSEMGPLAWHENPGEGEVRALDTWPVHAIGEGVKMAGPCDLDGDGMTDVVAAATGDLGEGVAGRWYRRVDATGRRWERFDITLESGRPGSFAHKGIACADFDGDARTDLAFTGSGRGNGVYWLGYRGESPRYSGDWDLHLVSAYQLFMKYDNVIAVDLDADGDADLLTTEESQGLLNHGLGVVWYENRLARRPRQVDWGARPGPKLAAMGDRHAADRPPPAPRGAPGLVGVGRFRGR